MASTTPRSLDAVPDPVSALAAAARALEDGFRAALDASSKRVDAAWSGPVATYDDEVAIHTRLRKLLGNASEGLRRLYDRTGKVAAPHRDTFSEPDAPPSPLIAVPDILLMIIERVGPRKTLLELAITCRTAYRACLPALLRDMRLRDRCSEPAWAFALGSMPAGFALNKFRLVRSLEMGSSMHKFLHLLVAFSELRRLKIALWDSRDEVAIATSLALPRLEHLHVVFEYGDDAGVRHPEGDHFEDFDFDLPSLRSFTCETEDGREYPISPTFFVWFMKAVERLRRWRRWTRWGCGTGASFGRSGGRCAGGNCCGPWR